MDCEHMLDLMQRYVDLDLTAEEEEQLNEHVDHCSQCATAFARLKALSDALLQLPKVTPKYSIVDAILPKLAEYDMQMQEREEGAALAQSVAPSPQESRTHRFFSIFSWKIIGSVAAAACAILLIIFYDRGIPEESPFVASEFSQASQESMPQPQSAPPTPEASPLADQPVKTPAGNLAKTRQDAPAEPATEEPVRETKRPEVTVFTNNPETSEPPPAEDYSAFSTADKGLGEDELSMSINTVDPALPEEQMESFDIGSELEEMEMLESSEDSKNAAYDDSHVTFADMKTSNDQYVAEVKDRQLIITSLATNEVVFNSTRQWSETEKIYSMGWTTDNKLYYEIADHDSIHAYLVDVQTRTELLIK